MWGMQKTETKSTSVAFQAFCIHGGEETKFPILCCSATETSSVTHTLQCNQAQPCGNCARRYPPPVCEYKTHNQR